MIEGFGTYAHELGISLYPAQEEAIFEIVLGNHVILNTPTGSGKSMVGAAAHFAALAEGKRSVYTAPIKALVSEKFFALCRDFGSDRVGMVTGDAAVNADAPIICCTARRSSPTGPSVTVDERPSTSRSSTSSTSTAIPSAGGRGRCPCSSSPTPSSC